MTTANSLVERIKGNDLTLMGRTYKGFNISQGNRDTILEFDNELIANNYKDETRVHYLRTLARLSMFIRKPLKEVDKKDMANFFVMCKSEGYGPEALEYHRISLKRFYKWLLGNDEFYPENVRWLKQANGLKKETLPEELLTKEEVLQIINSCDNPRDRALLMTLYESSARRGDLVKCKIKHLKFMDGYATLLLPMGKTGSYEAVLFDSLPFLRVWLDHHPARDDPDSALFTSIGNVQYGKALDVDGVYFALRKAAKRAGLRKRVYPHLLRKSISTEWARRGYTAEEINLRSGRRQGSKEAQVYIRLGSSDVKKHALRERGLLKDEKEQDRSLLPPVKCWKCMEENPISNRRCTSCGELLDEEQAKKEQDARVREKMDMKKELESTNQKLDAVVEMLAELSKRDVELSDKLLKEKFPKEWGRIRREETSKGD